MTGTKEDRMDDICSCGRSADHTVGPFTVCADPTCHRDAERELLPPTPLSELLARYGK